METAEACLSQQVAATPATCCSGAQPAGQLPAVQLEPAAN